MYKNLPIIFAKNPKNCLAEQRYKNGFRPDDTGIKNSRNSYPNAKELWGVEPSS